MSKEKLICGSTCGCGDECFFDKHYGQVFTESERDDFTRAFADWLFHEGMLYKPVNISCKQLIEQFKQTLK